MALVWVFGLVPWGGEVWWVGFAFLGVPLGGGGAVLGGWGGVTRVARSIVLTKSWKRQKRNVKNDTAR